MAGIIKAGRNLPQPVGAGHAVFNFDDMSSKAHGYLDSIRRQAAQILVQAREQAQQIRAQATEQGRQTAVSEAEQNLREEFDQQVNTLLPALRRAIHLIEQSRQSWLNQWEASTVRLACLIAAKILRRELTHSPELPVTLVREALELTTGTAELSVHLNPQDHAALADQIEQLSGEFGKLAPSQIVADPDVSPGGCRISTEFGSIDQRIEAQLRRIEEELT